MPDEKTDDLTFGIIAAEIASLDDEAILEMLESSLSEGDGG